ncbi:MAG TPA: RloB family protein [Tepidisphaeraceae bacterium]|jgi:hypothetical protein|nr:RloB family protein [Tepidisphaeraceae bacterium]
MSSRYGSKRTIQTRPIIPIIEIVCDDTRTAVEYFRLLKQEVHGKKIVNVVPAPKAGATADDVLGMARTPSPEDKQDKSFALIDIDTNPDVISIKKKAQIKQVHVLFSNPCFEVWTLAHLQNTGEAFLNCNAVLTRLKQKWKEEFGSDLGPKAQARYENLVEKRNIAITNCKSRNPNTDQSWTEVWHAVEKILRE